MLSYSFFLDVDSPLDTKQENTKNKQIKFEGELHLAKKAMITIMKSWTGLIYLGSFHLLYYFLFFLKIILLY